MDNDANCKVCEQQLYGQGLQGICRACCETLGLVEMPPARRSARPCTVCNHMKFIRVIPREYTSYAVKNGYIAHSAPMTLTRETGATDRWVFPGKKVPPATSLEGGRGSLETYVCTTCGFVEWYCPDPESIPIGPEFMSEVVDYDNPTPFR